jgi:hypothetical protein
MAGGIFPGYAFELNFKCIIFSLLIMSIYLINPSNIPFWINSIILFIIFIVSYVAMAWYDYFFNCTEMKLIKSQYGITDILKPDVIETNQNPYKKYILLSLLHLTVFAILLYSTYQNPKNQLLYALGVFTFIYHIQRIFKYPIISIFHILMVSLIGYIYYIDTIPQWLYYTLQSITWYVGLKWGYKFLLSLK